MAVGLIASPLVQWAAFGALSLVAAFAAAIAVALARHDHVECHCFGALGPRHLGWPALVRNIALAGVAALLAARAGRGGGPADSWATTLGDPAVAVVVAGSSLASVAVARCRATNRTIGASPPRALLRALRRTGLEAGGTATAVLLVFWDASCTACEQLLPYLRARAADPADDIALAIVSTDGVEATRTTGLELPVIDDEDRTITHALAIPGKPAAILLDSRGRIASDLILGTARIAAAIAAQAPSRER